ncbi:hypothetical protein [Chryseolinea lacunae]|uniref:Uncharacterized protein n=1 Tax=Chryseolinea lacunae TaxID=2801331 RepID=A0ABS1KW16_9BACT|nr:hypothetical protein [Chryseolinea lacunae]MBL0743427.1 hypothetical protein [Chryseolinea lacunae]
MKTGKRIWTLALGIIAAMAVVFFQLFYFQTAGPAKVSKKSVKTEQKENQSDKDEAYFSLPSSNLPSSAHVQLNQDVFFLFEILLGEDASEERNILVASPLKKIFSTLLGCFISPNAP